MPKPYLPFLIAAVVLAKCTCNYHIQRATAKCGTIGKDTIIVRDTIRVPSVQHDTIFNYFQHDTVIIKEGRLTMKYFYSDSLVYLSGKCDTIVRYIEVKVPIENVTIKEGFGDWVKRHWWIPLACFGFILLVRWFAKFTA